jgi:hypothetical protein
MEGELTENNETNLSRDNRRQLSSFGGQIKLLFLAALPWLKASTTVKAVTMNRIFEEVNCGKISFRTTITFDRSRRHHHDDDWSSIGQHL